MSRVRCDGDGRWAWIPGGGLRSAPFYTPNLRFQKGISKGISRDTSRCIPGGISRRCQEISQEVFQNAFQDIFQEIVREVFQEVFHEVFRKVEWLENPYAKIVDFLPLGALIGPRTPDPDLARLQMECKWKIVDFPYVLLRV